MEFFKKVIFLCVWGNGGQGYLERPEKGIRFPGAGAVEQLYASLRAGNQSPVLCKSSN